MRKKAKVVMLPTEDVTLIIKPPLQSLLFYVPEDSVPKDKTNWTYQHLYITSDDEIKQGDWYYDATYKMVINEKDGNICGNCFKIIATTDKSLFNMDSYAVLGDRRSRTEYHKIYLPSPSEGFIKEYCKRNGEIEDVEVEYDIIHADRAPNGFEYILKINPDNTVNIYIPEEEKLYTKEDMKKSFEAGMEYESLLKRGWKDESNNFNDWFIYNYERTIDIIS